MKQLVAIMSSVLAAKPSHDQMVENILSFAVEFSTIHPFANQNGRMMQLLMELLAYQARLEPFHVSRVNKLNSYQLTRSIEETILYQTVQPLLTTINRYKNEQNISINDNESIGSFFGHAKRKNSNTILHKTMHSLLPPLKNKKVLDAGCGIGTYAKYFADNGASVVGIDASQMAINRANQTATEQTTFVLGNLEQPLNYLEDESFDFIFSYLVIHYVMDWDRLFKDFFRILKAGGSAIITVPHPNRNVVNDYFSVEKTTEVFYTETASVNIEYYRRPLQMMLNQIAQAGFQINKTIEFNKETKNPTNILFCITKNIQLITDNKIAIALDMAKQAFDTGDFPVGSMMVSNGEVISKAKNEIFTKNNYHHAEINLIENSLEHQNAENKVVYVTLEPCLRCAQALVDFGVKEVFYILDDPRGGGLKTLHENQVKTTKIGDYTEEYSEILFEYYSKNPHLPQQISEHEALYELVKHHKKGDNNND